MIGELTCRWLWLLVAATTVGWWAPGLALSQDRNAGPSPPTVYTALAIRTVGVTVTQPIEITVERWTTDAEYEALQVELREGGQSALLTAMRALPDLGRLSSTGAVGIPLKYARRVPRADRSAEVTIITERAMSFWEATQMPRSTAYPLTVIEMDLDARGEGEGRVLVATNFSYDRLTDQLVIENFEDAPVLLRGLRQLR